MTVFRIHIRPHGGDNDPKKSFKYCLKEGVLGMGWAVVDGAELDWGDYIAAAEQMYEYEELHRVRYLHREVKENDLIWTRDTMGRYYLGRVISPWEYLATAEALRADIVNICRCELFSVDADAVPGKVVASFRRGRTIQAIHEQTVAIYSQRLWNRRSNTNQYTQPFFPSLFPEDPDIYTFLDDIETENAVAIYLQMRGWLYLPASRQPDTMGYEYILIKRNTFEKAVVQVKTGDTELNRDDFSSFRERVFLFQSYGKYTGSQHPHVECIDPNVLHTFLFNNRDILPQSITRWVDYLLLPPVP